MFAMVASEVSNPTPPAPLEAAALLPVLVVPVPVPEPEAVNIPLIPFKPLPNPADAAAGGVPVAVVVEEGPNNVEGANVDLSFSAAVADAALPEVVKPLENKLPLLKCRPCCSSGTCPCPCPCV
jgi:hypothetical protein